MFRAFKDIRDEGMEEGRAVERATMLQAIALSGMSEEEIAERSKIGLQEVKRLVALDVAKLEEEYIEEYRYEKKVSI